MFLINFKNEDTYLLWLNIFTSNDNQIVFIDNNEFSNGSVNNKSDQIIDGSFVSYDNNNHNMIDITATKKYGTFLKSGEKVLFFGLVYKYSSSSKSDRVTSNAKAQRVLLLTDQNRIIYIDPIGNIIREPYLSIPKSKNSNIVANKVNTIAITIIII